MADYIDRCIGYLHAEADTDHNILWSGVWKNVELCSSVPFNGSHVAPSLQNHFATVFDGVMLPLVDIQNILFKYWVSYRQLTLSLKHSNRCWKAVPSLIGYSWIFNAHLRVYFKNWTLKFKLLYLLNHISCFNEICRICCVNTRIQTLKVWLKSVLRLLKYVTVFKRIVFFLSAHPVVNFTIVFCRISCSSNEDGRRKNSIILTDKLLMGECKDEDVKTWRCPASERKLLQLIVSVSPVWLLCTVECSACSYNRTLICNMLLLCDCP